MRMHTWRMMFTLDQDKELKAICKTLQEEQINYKIEFDFEKKQQTLAFKYPSNKYDSIIKRLLNCR